MSKLDKGRVEHKLQGGKGNFAQQKVKPLFYVGYVILGRQFKGRNYSCDLAATSL
jgi:hypothetical protein